MGSRLLTPEFMRKLRWFCLFGRKHRVLVAIGLVIAGACYVIDSLLPIWFEARLQKDEDTPPRLAIDSMRPPESPPIAFADLIGRLETKASNDFSRANSIVVGNFVYSNSKVGSPISGYLQERFGVSIDRSEYFTLQTPGYLKDHLKERPFLLSSILNPVDTVGAIAWFDEDILILKGRFWELTKGLQVTVQLLRLRTGESYQDGLYLPTSLLPTGCGIAPDNAEQENQSIRAWESILPNTNSSFNVYVWPNKGNGATYSDGDTLTIYVYATQDCYMRLYHCGPDGRMQLLFRKGTDETYISGNTVYQFPRQLEQVSYVVRAPFGVDKIKAVVSLLGFSDSPGLNDFRECSPEGIKVMVKRGLQMIDLQNLASSTCVFTSVSR